MRLSRRATLLVAFSLLTSAATVLAFNEPDGFRGVPWGATEEQILVGGWIVGLRARRSVKSAHQDQAGALSRNDEAI